MYPAANGLMMFQTLEELYYDLFLEMGIGVRGQYLYDQDNGNDIKFGENFIKVSIDGQPVYAGRNEILFEPALNYQLISTLFGYYLDKAQNSEDGDILQGYIAHYNDDNETRDKQRVVVKTKGRGEISSNFYYQIYLAFIDCIFRIAGYNVDLSNFDVQPAITIKRKK
jgi:hypothetical protein